MMRRWQSPWAGPVSAVIVTLLAAAALVTAYGYSRSSGLFPVFVGWIFVALGMLETGLQLRTFRRTHAAAGSISGQVARETGAGWRELLGFVWLGLLLLTVYLLGLLIATPLFMFAFLKLAASRSLRYAGAAAGVATAFVYIVFVWLLEYRLFAGVLFGA